MSTLYGFWIQYLAHAFNDGETLIANVEIMSWPTLFGDVHEVLISDLSKKFRLICKELSPNLN